MTKKHPNVLFLTVDALRADRMSLYGYKHPTTPNLERLAQNGLVCDNTVSLASFTQPSYPSLLTSSRPLSFGGYDHGAFGRPQTVFETFHDAGYETTILSTFQWISRIAGYNRGIDHEVYLFILNTLVGVTSVILRNQIEQFRDGHITAEMLAAEAEPHLLKLFETIHLYCEKIETQSKGGMAEFVDSRVLNESYNYTRVRQIVDKHHAAFLAGPAAYVAKYFPQPFQAHEWLSEEWRFARSGPKLMREALFKASNNILKTFNPKLAKLRDMRFKRYVDCGAPADRIIRSMEEHTSEQPFFIWTHFIDTHVPYCPGRGTNWYRKAPGYLEAIGHSRNHDISVAVTSRPQTPAEWETWSALYDATVYYVDEQIGRILDALDRLDLRDDTVIAFSSDHGEELGDHGDVSHHFRFYSHNVRVPLIYSGPGVKAEKVSSLTTLLDVVPTIADFCSLPKDPAWEGQNVTDSSVKDRKLVVLESFHGGSCAFAIKPVYMAVRDGRYNYLWKEYLDPTDHYSAEGPELYDTVADPAEKKNIYYPDHPIIPAFNAAIIERLKQIPEISLARIQKSFDSYL